MLRKAFKKLAAVLTAGLLLTSGLNSAPVLTTVNAAAGDTPPHSKTLTDNHDGTYTISLDIVGEAEKQPNNVNVIVVFDRSGSMDNQRMTAAKSAVNNLADKLYAYNTQSAPNTVQMALVSFSTNATTSRTPTNSATEFKTAVSNLTASGGTNWEAALDEAGNVNFGDDDQTFVIFVSDGNPTFRDTRLTTDYLPQGDNPQWSDRWGDPTQAYYTYRGDQLQNYSVYGLGSDNPNNTNYSPTSMQRCYDAALPNARAIVGDVGGDHFFTIGAFGNVGRMQTLTTAAGAPASNFYNANDTDALNQALADILAKIEMMGIANAEIDDGTTNQVRQNSGEIAELLEVDTSSFKYYRSGGTYGTMQPWADAPAAEFVNGTVEWDLADEGVLENGVRYTVTFDCYPSQYTYDTIAKLKNGDITYDSLDSEVQKYIVDNGGGNYSLRTNTNASISWDDTRDEAGKQTSAYVNPDPVATSADQFTIEKKWEGGTPPDATIPITVLMDDEPFHTANLSSATSWKTQSYISVGIIKNGQALAGAEGHDFSFAELDDTQYRWEIDAPTVRPMLINGGGEDHTPTMLIKVDEKHPAPSGAQTYTIEGNTYYVDSAAGGLTATNYRRSNLNLTKVVTGEDAPADATFPFTLTVNNSKAPATEPTDDPEHNSDYWVWFSIYDTNASATVMDATVSGATGPSTDGYYYAPSGTAISVDMEAGWNLRFTNLPSGTTYTFAEGDLADGFAFAKSELTEGTDTSFSGAKTTTGTIQETKTSYAVTYTNDYQLTDLEITKVWEDNNNQDGKRLTPEELAEVLTLSPAVEGATPTVTENVDEEGNPTGTYTITYTGLPRFNNGQEVTYTVAEGEVEGYTTTGSPASDHGTITNTHEPEKTAVYVEKVWIGPEKTATIHLLANGTDTGKSVTLPNEGSNTAVFEDLDKFANGVAIEYTVTEDAIADYSTVGPTGSGTEEAPFVFTNTNDETVDVPVIKVWVGPEAANGATIHLLADGTDTGTSVTLPDAEGRNTYTFTGLRKYNATTGQEITYTVSEDVIAGYTTAGPEGDATAGFTFTNTSDERVSVPVRKVWDDADDQDGKRPDSVTVNLLANGAAATQEGVTATQTLSETNEWEYTWTNLYKYDQTTGEEITYTVTENAVTDYTTSQEVVDGTVVITNSYTPGVTSVTVTKAWDDANDQDGFRPESVEVTLLADGEPVSQTGITAVQTLNADNSWTYTWNGLNQKKAGVDIVYTVEETETEVITGTDGPGTYSYEVTGDATEGYTVTNTHTPEKTAVYVRKVWVGPEATATIRLLANGESTGKAVTLPNEGSNDAVFEDLDKYANGEEIVYTVTEDAIQDYTTAGPTGTGTANDPFTFTNTNAETVSVPVTKVWVGPTAENGATIHLLADGEDTGATVTLPDAEGKNTYTFTGLRKYDETTGEEITYSVSEDQIAGYTTVGPTGSAETGFTFTNTSDERVSVPVRKVWNDADDQDGVRPDSVTVNLLANDETVTQEDITATQTLSETNEWKYTWTNLYKYDQETGEEIEYTVTEDAVADYTTAQSADEDGTVVFTNTHTPATTEVKVTKVWEDADNQDGFRPGSVEVTLLANGQTVSQEGITAVQTLNADNSWTYTWTGLNQKSAGQDISYTVRETTTDVITGTDGPGTYSFAVTGDAATGYTVTNTHTPELTEASVQKVWDDADNQDGKRPESLTVTLSNGTAVTLNEENGWTATVEDLPKFAAGVEIEYTWTEGELPEGYALTNTSKTGTLTTLTNTHSPQVTSFDVEKVWADNNNQDGIRPGSVTVQLTANGTATGDPVELNADNSWKYQWTNLPAYSNGQLIAYAADETAVPEGYTKTVAATETKATITNTHDPSKTSMTVTKVWADDNNFDEVRPETVTVQLYADGAAYGDAVTLNEGSQWTNTWSDLPEFQNGVKVTYTVDELEVPAEYTKSVTGEGTAYTITNTHESERVSYTVSKTWNDDNNRDGIRPGSIDVTLYANGEPVVQEGITATVTLNAENGWQYTWSDLLSNIDGEAIVYTADETAVPEGYEETVVHAEDGRSTAITNSHDYEKVSVQVNKAWDDADNQDGIRPASVTVTLMADGTAVGEAVTLEESNSWQYIWENLPKNNAGTEIEYTVVEDDVDPYEATVTYSQTGNVITALVTNSYSPQVTTHSVQKVWNDADNQDGFRPDSITVTLKADGGDVTQEGIVATQTLSDDNNWTYTWEGLNLNKAGRAITYTVTEDWSDDRYTSVIEETTATSTLITNSHTPEETEATVKKVWDDAENQDGKRPETLSVTLSNGTAVTLSESNKWTATVTGLPKYAAGVEIEYTWTEGELPEGYELTDTSVEGTITTLTNTHEPEETEATVKKVWDDNEDKNQARPAELSVTLSDGTTVVLNEENEWTETVTGLPKYEPGSIGVEVEYTWTEDEVPEGYTLTGNTTDATITTLTNTFTDITVEKIDDDKKAVTGAVLAVKDENGEVVDQWKTDGTAHLIKGLTFGKTYTLTEVTVPAGYEKAADITFTADSVKTIKMIDKKVVVPDTSDHRSNTAGWMLMMMTSMLTAGLAFATRKKYSHN